MLVLSFAACGKTTPEPPTETTLQPAYSYQIQTIVEETRGNIKFEFSRPVFAGTSPLVGTANAAYDQMEAEYKSRMEEAAADYAEEAGSDPWNFTEHSRLIYERHGVLSFVTEGDWFMGGVHNSWIAGHTFDFNLGRELKIADFLQGDDADITAALVDAFKGAIDEMDVPGYDYPDAWEQSGPDANFYLAEDGVHVFYMPYVVPATQNGVDVFIPWFSRLMKREYNPPVITTQPVEGLAALEETTTLAAESEAEAAGEQETAKIPQTKEELVAYYNEVVNRVKAEKPGFTWTLQNSVSNIASSSGFIERAADMAMRFVSLDVDVMPAVAKGADHNELFNVRGQSWGGRLTPQPVSRITLADKGAAWELRVELKPEKRSALAVSPADHDHGRMFTVMTYNEIHDAIDPYAFIGKMERFAPSYRDSWAVLTIDKETDRLLKAEYKLTMDASIGAKFAVFPAFDATATISRHEVYKIG